MSSIQKEQEKSFSKQYPILFNFIYVVGFLFVLLLFIVVRKSARKYYKELSEEPPPKVGTLDYLYDSRALE